MHAALSPVRRSGGTAPRLARLALGACLAALLAIPAAGGPLGDDAFADGGAVGLIEAPDDAGPARAAASSDEPIPGLGPEDGFGAPLMGAVPEGAFSLAPQWSERAPRPFAGIPVVVELFTAQGCSTCPAADAMIADIADRPDVLALGWHVDYWDYLGSPDGYARPDHTVRQQGYAAAAGERGVYTPQILVDGSDTLIGADRSGLMALIEDHASRPPAIMASATRAEGGYQIDLTPRAAIPGGLQVLLIRYLPSREVDVGAGENRGRRILYRNIVIGMETVSRWPARTPLRLTLRTEGGADAAYPLDTRHALLVQQRIRSDRPGPILAALRLD
ncbi:DUF1223 domain-containing protein [Paracoccus contaminans]|uniref:DUF1223 domain-containing protein n=1 Tax=Paracoccus contaminans TaxID=1945662 RepID=A0A1W6CYQ5_9RHOB|nr:DUF1223 domain-containing protein [Paracoccus contaminans]ARJ69992.1 hypothetical protein B0A89_10475 [Paracoccus contaminans]